MRFSSKGRYFGRVVSRSLMGASLMLGAVFAAGQSQTTASYSFTLASGMASLTDAVIIDVQPDEADATITLLNGTYTPNAGQPSLTGTITGYGPQYLVLMGVLTDTTGNEGVAVSMPTALANSTILSGSWDTFNSSTNFPFGLLPSQAQTLADLIAHTDGSLAYPAYNYLNGSSNVIAPPNTTGTVVDFDSPVLGGSFTYAPVPEPPAWLLIASSMSLVVLRRKRNA